MRYRHWEMLVRLFVFLMLLLTCKSPLAWYADDSEDQISGRKIFGVYVKSLNKELVDGVPGRVHAKLHLRNHPVFGNRAIVVLSAGMLNCSASQKCSVYVRFDDGKPIKTEILLPDDGSRDTFLIANFKQLVSGLKRSKRSFVAVPMYRAGIVVFEFDTEDFSEKMLKSATTK